MDKNLTTLNSESDTEIKLWGLEKNSYIAPVRDLVDSIEYAHALSSQHKEFLNLFLNEYYRGESLNDENALHNTPELKKSINDNLNAIRRSTPLRTNSIELHQDVVVNDDLNAFETVSIEVKKKPEINTDLLISNRNLHEKSFRLAKMIAENNNSVYSRLVPRDFIDEALIDRLIIQRGAKINLSARGKALMQHFNLYKKAKYFLKNPKKIAKK